MVYRTIIFSHSWSYDRHNELRYAPPYNLIQKGHRQQTSPLKSIRSDYIYQSINNRTIIVMDHRFSIHDCLMYRQVICYLDKSPNPKSRGHRKIIVFDLLNQFIPKRIPCDRSFDAEPGTNLIILGSKVTPK